jgi:sugar lactone lactonase YvrE
MSELRTVVDGLVVGESPRWHEGRLWLAHWGAGQIMAVGPDGGIEVVLDGFDGFPLSIDWLPDGRLLIVDGPRARLLRREPDGTLVTHADLSGLAGVWNEIVVDPRGNIYVNGGDFDFLGGGPFVPGVIAVITPDGAVRRVAGDMMFPNGMVTTPDTKTLIVAESFAGILTAFDIAPDGSLGNRRVWADLGGGGDGIALDAAGAVWTPALDGGQPVVLRVDEGGAVLRRFDLDQFCYACAVHDDRVFLLVADWHGPDRAAEVFTAHSGRILTAVIEPA